MADWRQIQARIRKAKASADAAAQLAELYERTRDAMVAFELARWQERVGEHAEAARWYTAAAERFRRSQWKTKAEAALARLRAPASPCGEEGTSAPQVSESVATETETDAAISSEANVVQSEVSGEAELPPMGGSTATAETAPAQQQKEEQARKKPRRRGRRGGRNRRRAGKGTSSETAVSSAQSHPDISPAEGISDRVRVAPPPVQPIAESSASTEAAATAAEPPSAPWRGRSRAGEPALASRMAHLESQLRRLLACPLAKLEVAESAPAGPGVLLLSDSDQVTHYYVESCQTLRIAIGNLVRGGRGAKDLPQLRERMADNLGIAESRVTNYLKEHCAVRWLQLDEGASELAHFAIAVLRPVVNVNV